MKDIRNYSLLHHNTFGIDVQCRRFIEFSTEGELKDCLQKLTDADAPLLVLGGGSNLLLTGDYTGTVLHSAIMGIEPIPDGDMEHVLVRVGSGECWDGFVAYSIAHGWYGAENLSLIPGEVGACAVQNIGAYGVEAKDLIERVEAVEISTGKSVVIENEDCRYGYRQSRFKQDWKGCYVITHVVFRLSTTFVPHLDYGNVRASLPESPTAAAVRRAIIAIRQEKLPDPKVLGNAGSFFMNPLVPESQYLSLAKRYPDMPHYPADSGLVKIPAGWLIEHCGWKGRTLGPAGVHDKQALVLVNRGGATGQDIVALCRTVQADVQKKFGIDIQPEVNIVGTKDKG